MITENQQKILRYIMDELLTQKAIGLRLKISQQAVSKIVKKLRLKGYLKNPTHKQYNPIVTTPLSMGLYSKPLWRVEGLYFRVFFYYKSPKYDQIREGRGNFGISEGKYTIMLHRHSVRIQSKVGVCFRGETQNEALLAAEDDFIRFLTMIAEKYGFYYFKEGRVSIKSCSLEIVMEKSPFAKVLTEVTGIKLWMIPDQETKKIMFKVDMSKKTPEEEYIGANAYEHSEKLKPYIIDLMLNNPLTNSQLSMRMTDMVVVQEKVQETIQMIVKKLENL